MIENPDQLVKLISVGVYVIGVSDGEHQNAFTAACVMQVSFDPLLLAVSINPEHYSYRLLKAGGVLTVNVLGQHQHHVAEHFGRSVSNKMDGFDWRTAETGAPALSDALAYFDCRVSHYADAGDHKLAICEVLAAAKLNAGRPLLYSETGDMDGGSQLFAKR
ncbi:MAG: flavin reductase family protein [Gammaproteobacteria bacterium]